MKALLSICLVTYLFICAAESLVVIRQLDITYDNQERMNNRVMGRSPAIASNK